LDTLLPKAVDCCIILYEEKLDSGHWTALSRYAGRYEHFDSYGVAPDTELHWVNLDVRARLNERTPYLSNLLKKESYIYNTVPLPEQGARPLNILRVARGASLVLPAEQGHATSRIPRRTWKS
jgi:hypothetical protein